MEKLRSTIASISISFVENFRLTLMLTLAILAFGALSYTTFLRREGFPAVQFPLGIIQATYFVNDASKVDKDLAVPLETSIEDIEAVTQVDTTVGSNFVSIFVQFDESVTSEEGMKTVRDEVLRAGGLPEEASVEFTPFNAGSIDGTHDLVFTISGEGKSIKDLQKTADVVAAEVTKASRVQEANTIYLTTEEVDPSTGEAFDYQRSFKRYGENKDGKLVFQPAVSIGVKKDGDVGTIELSESVREAIAKVEKRGELDGYEVSYGGDFADGLKLQIKSLENNALFGFLAVIAVLYIFINWRAALATFIFMPIALGLTFTGMYFIGYTLNVISLFALILVLGLFVDDAVVVTEAIDYQKRHGKKGLAAVREAVKTVSIADISGTLTTILVFVPMAAISGILGEFIVPIPVTVILAMSCSLIIALSLNVFYSNALLPERNPIDEGKHSRLDWIINWPNFLTLKLGILISRLVKFYLHGRFAILKTLIVLLIGLGMIGFGLFMAGQLKFSIFPEVKDSDEIIVSLDFPEGSEIVNAELIAADIEKIVADKAGKEIESVDYYDSNSEAATMYVTLIPMKERDKKAPAIVKDLNAAFAEYDKAIVKSGVSSVGPPTSDYQYTMQVYADDQDDLKKISEEVRQFILKQKLSNEDVKIEDVIVTNIDLITKTDGRRYAAVKAKLTQGATTGDVVELKEKIENNYTADKLREMGLDEDTLGYNLGQESENLDSFNSAGAAMLIALAAMYVLLLIQFNSFSKPFLVFLAIPFGFAGLFPGLYLTDNPLSFFVMIGAIGLTGIVVNNTIMLLDYADQARAKGMSYADAISNAVGLRFRPLLTTSATTIAGMLPLALDDPFWEGLAFTIVFGLISSATMVVFVFPAYYVILEQLRENTKKAVAYLAKRASMLVTTKK